MVARLSELDVQRLVDGLGGRPHLGVIGAVSSKSASDLIGRVVLLQVQLDPRPQGHIAHQLRWLRPTRPLIRQRVLVVGYLGLVDVLVPGNIR